MALTDSPDSVQGGAGVSVLVALDLVNLGGEVATHDGHLLLQAAKTGVTERRGPSGVLNVSHHPPPIAPLTTLTHTSPHVTPAMPRPHHRGKKRQQRSRVNIEIRGGLGRRPLVVCVCWRGPQFPTHSLNSCTHSFTTKLIPSKTRSLTHYNTHSRIRPKTQSENLLSQQHILTFAHTRVHWQSQSLPHKLIQFFLESHGTHNRSHSQLIHSSRTLLIYSYY